MNELPSGTPRIGEVLAGRYRIDRVLGSGGMGFVLAATHVHLHERVAIKMLMPAIVGDPDIIERFLREGRAAVRIRSEHVVRILDVAELPDRTPYIVMEYLDGSDLQQIVQQRGAVAVPQAVDWVLEACEALAEAHAMKIVHRDLKPANMFLAALAGGREVVKVLDFGISKMAGTEGGLALTKTSAMLGSPLYMSPEQLKSSRYVDERTDIWALGVILYELVAGRPPFYAESIAELGVLVLSGEAPRLATAIPNVDPAFSDVVATCLQKRAEDRFVNLADFAEALAPFGGPGARESASTIVRTLGGLPSTRARIACTNSAPRSSEPALLQRTHVMADSSPRLANSASFALASSAAAPVAPATTMASRGRAAAVAAVAAVALAATGGTLIYVARTRTHTAGAASATSTAAARVPSAPSESSSAAPSPAEPRPTTAPSGETAVPVPAPSAIASTAPKPTRDGARPKPATSAAKPAPAKPPSGIATSSKD